MIPIHFITPEGVKISKLKSSKYLKFRTPRGKIYNTKNVYFITCNLVYGETFLDKHVLVTEVTPYTEQELIKAAELSKFPIKVLGTDMF